MVSTMLWPGIARGFSVFGSVSRAIPDLRLTNIVPKAAICDPVLTLGLPAGLTAATGNKTITAWDIGRRLIEWGEDAGFERSEVEARRTRGGIFWSHHAWF
jgi:hypothetical protein